MPLTSGLTDPKVLGRISSVMFSRVFAHVYPRTASWFWKKLYRMWFTFLFMELIFNWLIFFFSVYVLQSCRNMLLCSCPLTVWWKSFSKILKAFTTQRKTHLFKNCFDLATVYATCQFSLVICFNVAGF